MFLEIITRHLASRPNLLAHNYASLAEQTDADWEQTMLVDNLSLGVEIANERLAGYSAAVKGEYAWVLDDDDACCRPTLVAELKELARAGADVVMMKMDHGPRGILPPADGWGQAPVKGSIGASAFVVRRELWHEFGEHWNAYRAADFEFINAVWQSNPVVVWHDVVASRVQALGGGRPELELEVLAWPR